MAKGKKYRPVPKKHGRPTAYHKDYDDRVYRFALLGLGEKEMAECFGVSEQTLNAWKGRHKGFLESLLKGKVDADANVADRLYQRALGYSHQAVKIFMPAGASEPVYAPYIEHYPPDTGAAKMWLINRQRGRWAERIDHQLSGPNGGPIEQVTTQMTPEEATRVYLETVRGSGVPKT